MLAISVGGSSATLATEKILMILFWLMLMKPTVASIRKLILSNRKARVAVERVDVAQDLARLLELLGVEHAAAHHEADRAARVHHVAADAAVQVFLARDRRQRLAGRLVVDVLLAARAR